MRNQLRRTRRAQRKKYLVVALGMIVFLLMGCQAGAALNTAVPDCGEAHGTIVRDKMVETERGYPYDFQVYLPPCYEVETERIYPVLYVIPGMGGSIRDWFSVGVNDIADEVILAGEVAPFIIVHTANSNAAEPGGGIIANELVPYVQSTYRILPDRRYHSVAGGSLGGLATYRIVFQNPDYFANGGIFGSGVISGLEDELRGWIAETDPEMWPRVFFNSGEEDPLMVERAVATIEILDEAGVENTAVFSAGGHDYRYWASNFAEYYRWMAQDWQ